MDFSTDFIIERLAERGVTIDSMAELVLDIQKKYTPSIDLGDARESILRVLEKREVAYTILTGISIDMAAENGHMGDIEDVIKSDNPLYGLDEILALSIVNVHGSIALTNFGYLDKIKPGIIGELDRLGKTGDKCHTYLDDIVSAIVSSAASRLAHSN